MPFLLLALAIAAEVVGTTALKASNGFTRPLPSLLVVLGYGTAFYLLSIVLRSLPIGLTYAIWSGAGILLVTLIGAFHFREIPNAPTIAGMLLIIAGVVVLNLAHRH